MALAPRLKLDENPVETLRQWLSDKPNEWGPALATRSALRTFPWAFGYSSPFWIERYAIPVMHSLFVAWSTATGPIRGHKLSAELATNVLYQAAMYHEPEAYFASAMRNISSAIAAKQKLDKVDHSLRAIVALQNLTQVREAIRPAHDFLWNSIEADIRVLLARSTVKNNNARDLMRSELISRQYGDWGDRFKLAQTCLLEADDSFQLWKDWLDGVVSGRNLNFFDAESSPDARVKDRQVASSILQERNAEFWTRPAANVNHEIAKWVEAAAQGVLADPGELAQVPPQNENAISFQANSSGKIELSSATHYDALRDDRDTRDRYEECLALAQEMLSRCEGSNAASRLTQMLRNYLDAAGSDVSSLRPSIFVQRGERLRQELAAYQSHDTLLPPLADDLLLDLRAWQASHNMLVGLDPALMARDVALSGPDVRVANVPPNEIRDIAIDADSAGILADGVAAIVVESSALAPEVPDPANRRTIWSFETGRNLVIETFNLALRHPGKAAVGALISGATVTTLGVGGAVVSLAAGSIPAAKFLLRHRSWIETRLGDSPTWRALFGSLCEWLEENTPLRNERD